LTRARAGCLVSVGTAVGSSVLNGVCAGGAGGRPAKRARLGSSARGMAALGHSKDVGGQQRISGCHVWHLGGRRYSPGCDEVLHAHPLGARRQDLERRLAQRLSNLPADPGPIVDLPREQSQPAGAGGTTIASSDLLDSSTGRCCRSWAGTRPATSPGRARSWSPRRAGRQAGHPAAGRSAEEAVDPTGTSLSTERIVVALTKRSY
jgi:hypothetical protein